MAWVAVASVMAVLSLALYVKLCAAFCGYPHRCPKHGWRAGCICTPCDIEYEAGATPAPPNKQISAEDSNKNR